MKINVRKSELQLQSRLEILRLSVLSSATYPIQKGLAERLTNV